MGRRRAATLGGMAKKREFKRAAKYTVSDGEITLELRDAGDGWWCVTSPMDPGVVTQAKSIEEAFYMAYDARDALRAARHDLHGRLQKKSA